MPALGAVLLLLVAFLTTGGDVTVPVTSWVDVILILAGGLSAAALVITRRSGGGTLSFGLFTAVAVLTALSILWSVAPDQSWEESGRTVAYVATFGLALTAARFGDRRSHGALLAVTSATLGLCVWALVVKVLNLNLYGQPAYGPVLAPFGYWNSTGVIGALALPGLIWLASGRERSRLTRGLATAGITLAASIVVLSLSRSAVAAAVISTVVLLIALRHHRRRAVVVLLLGLVAGVPVWIYALTDHNVYGDTAASIYGQTAGTVHRAGAGLVLGLIILVMSVTAAVAGTAVSAYADRAVQPAQRLAWFDRGLRAVVAAVPVAIILWLLVNSRGPFGEISHVWRSLTSVKGSNAGGTSSRFDSVASSRSAYWRQAFSVGAHHLLGGAGAGTFFTAHLHYRTAALTLNTQDANHAHSYVLDTFASFGLVGVGLNAALLLTWCRDARRAISTRFGAELDPTEIGARWALIGVVLAFGVSSALDWTWYFQGVVVPALIAAGWIAGVSAPRRGSAVQLAPAGPGRPAGAPRPRPLAARPAAIITLTGLLAVTLAVAWESIQPMRSVQSTDASVTARLDDNPSAALADARAAVNEDPLSVAALTQLANVYGAFSEPAQQRAELVKATHTQPDNPQPFATLGGYLFCTGHDEATSLPPLIRATVLDITNTYFQYTLEDAAVAHQKPSETLCGDIG